MNNTLNTNPDRFVPQDPSGLLRLFPSTQTFTNDLDIFLANSTTWKLPNTIPNPWYVSACVV